MSLAAMPASPPRAAAAFVLLLAAALLWHLMLPSAYYRNIAVYLEGPLPTLAGAGVGLWLHRDERGILRLLAACLWAVIGLLAVIVVIGTLRFGPWNMLSGVWAVLRGGLRLPFAGMLTAQGGTTIYLFWTGIRTLLVWGAVAYLGLLALRPATRRRLSGWTSGYSEQRAFGRAQRAEARDYRRQYLAAVQAGQTPPAPPPILTAPALRGDWGGRAQLVYWLLRLGVAAAGALGLYAALQAQLADSLFGALLRGALGGF